jgi:hypothetical protein
MVIKTLFLKKIRINDKKSYELDKKISNINIILALIEQVH